MRCDDRLPTDLAGRRRRLRRSWVGPSAGTSSDCLRCQAELVQYRRLLRALRALRTEVLEPAPGLLAEVLADLEAAGERRAIRSLLSGRRAAYLGGLAAATAAGAAGAIVFAARAPPGRSCAPAS